MTVLDHLIAKLRDAAVYNRHDLAAPRVIIWTDAERAWSRVIGLLRDAVPELMTLANAIDARDGPSTALRYRLGRWDARETPIIYLPGVSRSAFRGAAGFPDYARHIFALQNVGQFWTQASGRDWTPFAFLTSLDGGLTLEVARDALTKDALQDQLEHVLRSKLEDLQGRRLEAADFHALVTSDPVRSLLQWLSNPVAFKNELKPEEWKSFASICKAQFGVDPEKEGALTAAERLVDGGTKPWNGAWQRYSEAPSGYGGLRDLLSRVTPQTLFSANSDRLPQVNAQKEDELRSALQQLEDLPFETARAKLSELCHTHGPRIKSVWAKLGEAPLAHSAFHLAVMAERIGAGLTGNDWDSIGKSYMETGWIIDTSAWKAYDCARNTEDATAVRTALRVTYLPWLERLAERIQQFIDQYPMSEPLQAWSLSPENGSIVMFVDGLRFDVGKELSLLLERSLEVEFEPRWTALPTVTATAKPAWIPLTQSLNGNTTSAGFEPTSSATGKPLKAADFRANVAELGWRWIDPSNVGDPQHPGWTEAGSFDRYGHDDGARLAWRLEEEIEVIADRVKELLKSGWKSVQIITDHGWLLMPGGLPKAELPLHLTSSRWGRCAFPASGAVHGYKKTPWFWGNEHDVVLAPGISVFKRGTEYTHGGLTVQEALTPVLRIRAASGSQAPVQIASARWVGMRVKVQLSGNYLGVTLDIRTKAAAADSSVLTPSNRNKTPDSTGSVSLTVEDDDRIGSAALVVIMRGSEVIAKQNTTIGGE
jgi:hypothetical protein